ncbi:DNA cytosine methyltransferase [Micromonospora chokoriensis]|uniref:DNA cytosine methyltransferase n=1 Tax=Micromonospora chokoriensis TaxID=356851 RepID=UPI000A05CD44|nr:DNA cytosine methyltransferase [Micromonospora chokoriensis]
MRSLDLFAGPGGWDIAAHGLGWDVDGVEISTDAKATRAAAGLKTIADDVRDVDPMPGEYDALIASPPCQSFSAAGLGAGRRALDAVLHGVRRYALGERPAFAELADLTGDERTALVLEPLRVALAMRPTFIAWEQVPPVLPVWQACADVLRTAGYSAAAGYLHAEQYGVPQTRKRAFLLARRDGQPAALPTPTHSRYHSRTPDRLDPGVAKWVSMADALGWQDAPVEAVKRMGRGMVERHGERPGRSIDAPAFTVRAAAGGTEPGGFVWKLRSGQSWEGRVIERRIDRPSLTLLGSANRCRWERGEETRKVTVDEVATLQTFPADFPFQGGKSAQLLQVGNAAPPKLTRAVLTAAVA